MEDFNIPAAKAVTIHGAVRAGGASPWSQNAAERSRRERRVLACFPEDPRMT
jgi:hypothetical protein